MMTTMKQRHTAIKRKGTTTVHHARKVGGIWVDPMSFPTLTEYDNEDL